MKEIEVAGNKRYLSKDGISFDTKKACQQHEKRDWFDYLYASFDVKELPRRWDSDYTFYSFRINDFNKHFLPLFFSLMMEFTMAQDGCTIVSKDVGNILDFNGSFAPSKILKTLKADADMPIGIYMLAVNWLRDDGGSIYVIDARILSQEDATQDIWDKMDDYEKAFEESFFYGVY